EAGEASRRHGLLPSPARHWPGHTLGSRGSKSGFQLQATTADAVTPLTAGATMLLHTCWVIALLAGRPAPSMNAVDGLPLVSGLMLSGESHSARLKLCVSASLHSRRQTRPRSGNCDVGRQR